MEIKSTTDCIIMAEQLHAEAKQVKNENEHGVWWDKKVDLLRTIDSAFETGYFTGDAYNELCAAKNILYRAEVLAGGYTYNR